MTTSVGAPTRRQSAAKSTPLHHADALRHAGRHEAMPGDAAQVLPAEREPGPEVRDGDRYLRIEPQRRRQREDGRHQARCPQVALDPARRPPAWRGRRREDQRRNALGSPGRVVERDPAAVGHTADGGAVQAGAVEQLVEPVDEVLEARRGVDLAEPADIAGERRGEHPAARGKGRRRWAAATPSVPGCRARAPAAGRSRHRSGRSRTARQFLRVLPVFSVCAIRACVFGSPHRLRNASRSRSRRCCSLTGMACGMSPPASTWASLRPMSAS